MSTTAVKRLRERRAEIEHSGGATDITHSAVLELAERIEALETELKQRISPHDLIEELHGVRPGDKFDSGLSRYSVLAIERSGYVHAKRSDGNVSRLWIDTLFNKGWRKL